jgi:hypothetical protein
MVEIEKFPQPSFSMETDHVSLLKVGEKMRASAPPSHFSPLKL